MDSGNGKGHRPPPLCVFCTEVPEKEYLIPIGISEVKREGEDVTIVATSFMVDESLELAAQLELERLRISSKALFFPVFQRNL